MSLKDIMSRGAFWAKKHSPEILTTTSAVAGIGALAFAFIKADKVKQKIQDHKERMEELNKNLEEMDETGEGLTDMEKRQVKTAEFIQTGKEVIKEAWPIILLESISLGTNIAGCVAGHKRYANASAALATLTSAFGLYRSRVAEKYGKDEERALYLGESEEEIEYVELDSEGKETRKKKAIKRYEAATPYCVTFESQWQNENGDGVTYIKNPRIGSKFFEAYENNELRYDWLIGIRHQCLAILKSRGHLYLSEVFDKIGYEGYQMDEEELEMARRCGWVYNKHNQAGDDFVLFGIEDKNSEHVKRFLDGDDDNIILIFNCVGDIYSLLKDQYTMPREFFRS